jgi:hypothetical protein
VQKERLKCPESSNKHFFVSYQKLILATIKLKQTSARVSITFKGRTTNEKKLYTRVQLHKNIMQLPRGTFREIRKAELISSLLRDLEQKNYSGICSISSEMVSGTLVFKSGKCILAKILNKSGDGAWEELQKMGSNEVDAALSTLDEAQIQLALEFNKPSRIIKDGTIFPPAVPVKPATVPHKPAPVAGSPLRPTSSFTAPPAPTVSKPVTPSSPGTAAEPRAAVPQKPVVQTPAQPARVSKPPSPSYSPPPIPVHHEEEPKKPAETPEPPPDSSSFEKDIDTFDTLDLDNVTDKIRNDCKTMIKQLELEHLMER